MQTYNMKRLTLIMLMQLFCTIAYCVPAKRITKTVRQNDGSILTMNLSGDESLHYYMTDDGLPLTEGADGSYYYSLISNGKLISSGILAHNLSKRNLTESSYVNFFSTSIHTQLSRLWSDRSILRGAHRSVRSAKMRQLFVTQRKRSPQRVETSNKRGLVILVNFDGKEMTSSRSQQEFNAMFNQSGYNKNQHIGSVRDYFKDQSYGQLTIDFDVVGPYPLSHDMSYYGTNDSRGDDLHPGEMVAEACTAADSDVDFSAYDWDGDGEVDQVYVIYAGYGEASGAPSTTIWPHEWDLTSSDYGKSMLLDNVIINTYACSNELSGTSGSVMDGIGTACHEFSHCLGFPDYYDTSGNNFGMDSWSLMDYGCYNGPNGYDGNVPSGYTAYERYFAGWIEPTELSEGCIVSGMRSITSSTDGYVIYNPSNRNECYFLTNIQKESWNTYAYDHGLLIQHIDYDANAWMNNKVNTVSNRQRCTIFAADSLYSHSSLSGDLYPGKSNSLTDTSKPASILYNSNNGSKLMSKPIEEISESNGLISFIFNGGKSLSAPTATEASSITSNSFTANWTSAEGASSYILELQEEAESRISILLNEDFSGMSVLGNSEDVSSTINQYTHTSGWSGTKLSSTGKSSIKLGSKKSTGTLTTPSINGIQSDYVTIYIACEPYSPLLPNCDLKVSYGNVSKTESIKEGNIALSFASNQSVNSSFTISTTENSPRAFISQITVLDGQGDVSTIESMLSAGENSGTSAVMKSTLYKDIIGTSYTFNDLTGSNYWYRVKAVDGKLLSEWSNMISVTLVSTGIYTPSSIESGMIKVYSLNGTLIREMSSSSELETLPRGIYIIDNGHNTKKIIK